MTWPSYPPGDARNVLVPESKPNAWGFPIVYERQDAPTEAGVTNTAGSLARVLFGLEPELVRFELRERVLLDPPSLNVLVTVEIRTPGYWMPEEARRVIHAAYPGFAFEFSGAIR